MKRNWIAIGAIWAGIAVALGAFGAHGLKSMEVGDKQLDWWHTATRYHMWHALGLMAWGLFLRGEAGKNSSWVGPAFFVGSLVFSGTLYAMALGAPSWLGAVTPIGGLLLIVGWFGFARTAWGIKA